MDAPVQVTNYEVPITSIREFGSVGPLIAVCGLSHHSAPIEILEKLAFTPDARAAALTDLTAGDDAAAWLVPEAVILSTCNRVELYVSLSDCGANSSGAAADLMAQFLADFHDLALETVAPYLYYYQGEDAVRHLFGVAAGLDSMILGEPQILGQVRGAIEDAQRLAASGPILSTLFRLAIETGKRVHTETGISHRAASVSYAAVEVAARHFPDLRNVRVLIVGAGKTGQLTAECLAGQGVRGITVVNRSYEHAAHVAEQWGGTAYTLDRLGDALPGADLVISCTNAPGYVITPEHVTQALQGRAPGRELLLIDIAVPRDIDPAAAELAGVRIYNVEDLRSVVDANLSQRQNARHQAETIVSEQVGSYMAWFMALAVAPVIADLRERAESIRQRELARARNRLTGLSPDYVGIIEMVTQRIINQLLHEPTVRLKQHAADADGQLYAEAVRDLFALTKSQCQE